MNGNNDYPSPTSVCLSLTLSHNHPCTFSPKWHTKSKAPQIQGLIILGWMWHTVTHPIQGLIILGGMWHTVTPQIQGLNVTYHSWCMWHTVMHQLQRSKHHSTSNARSKYHVLFLGACQAMTICFSFDLHVLNSRASSGRTGERFVCAFPVLQCTLFPAFQWT